MSSNPILIHIEKRSAKAALVFPDTAEAPIFRCFSSAHKYIRKHEKIPGYSAITYNGLFEITDRLGSILRTKKITETRAIGIVGRHSVAAILLIISAWREGLVPVLFSPDISEENLKKQAAIAGCVEVIDPETFLCNSKTERCRRITCEPENDALILFTSGSTGEPKGVVHSISSLSASAEISNTFLHYVPDDAWLLSLPLFHIGGFSILSRSLLFGLTVVVPDAVRAESLMPHLRKFPITLLSLVTAQLLTLFESARDSLRSVRCVLLGGGPQSNETTVRSVEAGIPVICVYGSTETASFIAAYAPGKVPSKAGSSGTFAQNVSVLILDEHGKPVRTGEIGLLCISSPTLFTKYCNSKSNTIQHDGIEYFVTGDYAFIDSDGYLFPIRRREDRIVSGGKNISSVKVADALLRISGITEAVVLSLPDERWGEIAAAALVCDKDKAVPADICAALSAELEKYEIPKRFLFLDSIPKTSLGKVDMPILKELFS